MLSSSFQEILLSADVTFRGSKPYFEYYTITSPLQVEINKEERMILPSFTVEKHYHRGNEVGERIHGKTLARLDRPDLITYSRRNRVKEAIMQSIQTESSSIGELSTFLNELDLPIAYRK